MNTDDPQLPELTRRQEEILSLIVRAYTQNPEPVSSKYLVDTTGLSVSSATIRNEMAILEELGYIAAPHTSAGRIPTENGYRYFVKRLLNAGNLTTAEQTRIAEKFQSAPLATEQWMRHAAAVLARTVNTAALVTPPIAETSKFKHLELIAIQGRLVLMVLVVHGGAVHQQMLTLEESISQEQLSTAAAHINALCANMNPGEVRIKAVHLMMVEREIAELAANMIEQTDTNQVRSIYREGLGEIINSFQNNEGAQQAVRVFEERAFLNLILGELLTPIINHVQVVIGGEGRWEELKHLSIVLSRYGVAGQFSGAVGVVGPTHLDYGRAVGAVRFVSGLMTNALVDLYASGSPPQSVDELENGDEENNS
jgi:heat-inducible transcriptional repressor